MHASHLSPSVSPFILVSKIAFGEERARLSEDVLRKMASYERYA